MSLQFHSRHHPSYLICLFIKKDWLVMPTWYEAQLLFMKSPVQKKHNH